MQAALIKTSNLGKTYGNRQVLRDLNLEVPANTIFGFLGPNGAGKTTTMKILLGLIRPTAGGATIFGKDVVKDSIAIRERVGFLAQDPRYYEDMTPREILALTASFFNIPAAEANKRTDELVELMDLQDLAKYPISGFSGGERQRLGLAQAQINNPDLLILDEPAAGLDPGGRHKVLKIMERLKQKTTIFYSTHILDDVQKVSDQIAILNKGQLIYTGQIHDLIPKQGKLTYSLTVKNNTGTVVDLIRNQNWVNSAEVISQSNDVLTLEVSVNDDKIADKELPRIILAQEDTVLLQYGKKQYSLEDIFLDLIEKNNE